MRLLIIGGTRFIGPHVVRALCAMGHEVVLFHRGQTEADLPAGVKHIHGQLDQLPDFKKEIKAFRPDVVLHMIAGDAQAAWTFVRTLEGIAQRVVAISSEDVYRAFNRLRGTEPGPPDPTPLAEDAPLREKLFPFRGQPSPGTDESARRHDMDDYDKIVVERIVMSEPGLPGTILRLPAVYGPNDPHRRVLEYLQRMDDRRPAILMGEAAARWRWTRGYVEDVAHAIVLALTNEAGTGKIYNVGELEALSEADWARQIGRAAGWRGEIVTIPDDRLPEHLEDTQHDWRHHWIIDTSRIRNELGYAETIPRDEALRRTVAWERANPPPKSDLARPNYEAEDAVLAEYPRR